MPSLHPRLGQLLQSFAAAEDPPADVLPARVRAHLGEIRDAARKNEILPLDLAEAIANGLLALLETPELSEQEAGLVHAAARYFVSNEDLRPDLHGPLGLDDDVLVFNHVAARLGRNDLEVGL
jgi:uncharacterized membrane protein YkvA (DUF1232 family)